MRVFNHRICMTSPSGNLGDRAEIVANTKDIKEAELLIKIIKERYDVNTKEELYEAIKTKQIPSHPAWEDHITWQNTEKDLSL